MTIQCSTKVCSFGKQVVEKLETEFARFEGGRFVYKIQRSPMCEYMINFILKLKNLPEKYMMNSVLENFTILQVNTYGGCYLWLKRAEPFLTNFENNLSGDNQSRHRGDATLYRLRFRSLDLGSRSSASHLPAGQGLRNKSFLCPFILKLLPSISPYL